MKNNLEKILKSISQNPLARVCEHYGVITNGHFAILSEAIPDSIRKKLCRPGHHVPAPFIKNIRNNILKARSVSLRRECIVRFDPTSSKDGIVYMTLNESTFVAYSQLYYEFILLLGCVLYHDVEKNCGYIVQKSTREITGLLMPVVVPVIIAKVGAKNYCELK
ncbi:hypothetical protein [Caldicellulosiruptor hydrothermalis]|uniref:hypothetical protein n=1 Tax=Caldicellulosiruptor hydrothermalis TaxID=413888 RepID=UPI0002F26B7E|nr:hypothetical protein [Caldicellulosiruptor hydrothermalis]